MTNSRRTNLFMEIASPPGFETEEREYVSFGSSRILKETEKQLIKFFQDKEQVLINFGQVNFIITTLIAEVHNFAINGSILIKYSAEYQIQMFICNCYAIIFLLTECN